MKFPSLPSLAIAAGIGLCGYGAYDYWSSRPVDYKGMSNDALQEAVGPGMNNKILQLMDRAEAELAVFNKTVRPEDLRAVQRTLDAVDTTIKGLATASQEACARIKDGRIKAPTDFQAKYLTRSYCTDWPAHAASLKRENDKGREMIRQALTP